MNASILVVENHADLRFAMVSTLRREKFLCDAVANGAAALLKLREHDYRYIFIDNDDATAASKLLETLGDDPSQNVILMTDLEGDYDSSLLRKPFDTKEMLAHLV